MEKLSSIVYSNAQMLSKLTGSSAAPLQTEISVSTCIPELEEFEERIKNVEEFSKMAQALSVLGGKDDGEATRRIISSIVGHELALRMNWAGGTHKRSIAEFPHVVRLVAAAVNLNKKFRDVTQLAVENNIKRWLRCAGDRFGGRNKRTKLKRN